MNSKMTILVVLVVSVMSFPAHCWMRNADIAASRDSLRLGLYSDFSFSYEKIIDSDTSFGLSYWPLPLSGFSFFRNLLDVSYNKQFYRDNKTSWSYFYGIFGMEQKLNDVSLVYPPSLKTKYYWQNFAAPTIGISYGYRFDDRWRARVNLLYFFDPYDMELAYLFSDNYEISIALSMTNSMFGVTYFF